LQQDQRIIGDDAEAVVTDMDELLVAVVIAPYRHASTIAGGFAELEYAAVDVRVGRGPMVCIGKCGAAKSNMAGDRVVLVLGRIDEKIVIFGLCRRADVVPALVLKPIEGLDQLWR
jgi:hypothetical protein